jgi:hypothetical protein
VVVGVAAAVAAAAALVMMVVKCDIKCDISHIVFTFTRCFEIYNVLLSVQPNDGLL